MSNDKNPASVVAKLHNANRAGQPMVERASCGLFVGGLGVGIEKGVVAPKHYKNRRSVYVAVDASPTLLLHTGSELQFSWAFFLEMATVGFWQRLKPLETEKTFAGQGAY